MFTFPVSHWASQNVSPPVFLGSAAQGGGPATLVITVSHFCAAGTIVAVFAEEAVNSTTFSTCVDSRSNSYSNPINVAGAPAMAVYYAVLTTALHIGDTISVTGSGGFFGCCAYNLLGAAPASPLDLTVTPFTSTGTSIAHTVPIRSYEPEIVFFWSTYGGGGGAPSGGSMGGGFSQITSEGVAILGYNIAFSMGTIAFTFTWTTGSRSYLATFVSFKITP